MDSDIYVQDNLNTTTVVVLQVLCHYEFMLEVGPLMTGNQFYKSQSCVASPHLTRLGEGALHMHWSKYDHLCKRSNQHQSKYERAKNYGVGGSQKIIIYEIRIGFHLSWNNLSKLKFYIKVVEIIIKIVVYVKKFNM